MSNPGSNENPDPYLQLLSEWEEIKREMDALKVKELDKRLLLCAGAFANPKEGTNTHKLPDGRKVVAKYTTNRKIDEAALQSALTAVREAGCANHDRLVRMKPELAKAEWNTLSDEMKLLFSPAVIATPGTPQLEITPAKGA